MEALLLVSRPGSLTMRCQHALIRATRCLVILDRFVSSSLGQPLVVHEEE